MIPTSASEANHRELRSSRNPRRTNRAEECYLKRQFGGCLLARGDSAMSTDRLIGFDGRAANTGSRPVRLQFGEAISFANVVLSLRAVGGTRSLLSSRGGGPLFGNNPGGSRVAAEQAAQDLRTVEASSKLCRQDFTTAKAVCDEFLRCLITENHERCLLVVRSELQVSSRDARCFDC